jgi:riboflavin kinase/FMN adenylyltransferase
MGRLGFAPTRSSRCTRWRTRVEHAHSARAAVGRFRARARLLGRPYAIGGHVVHGQALGANLGFPTANLRFGGKTPALSGIYATWVHGVGERRGVGVQPGHAADRGRRGALLEAHLFDFDGDLYGRRIEVEFVAKLRDELKFPDLSSLTEQMHRDADQARAILSSGSRRAIA